VTDIGLSATRAAPAVMAPPRARSRLRPRVARRPGTLLGYGWTALVVLFIYAPIIVVIGASFDPGYIVQTRAFLMFPPHGFSLRWYFAIQPSFWYSLWFSLELAAGVAAGALAIGIPAAFGLVRGRFPGRWLVDALFRAPLQIPFIVTGVAFLQTYYFLSASSDVVLQGTFAGLFLGHLFVAVPYTIGSVAASLQRFNPRVEEAALTLGASRLRVLWRVTLPILMPGIYGGMLYAFLISFTEVTISVFLAGTGTMPLPVAIFNSVTSDMEPTVPALSTLVFLGSLVLVYGMQRLMGLETLLRSGGSAT
jgi:putative spermidine/putrescine transport system permease protein